MSVFTNWRVNTVCPWRQGILFCSRPGKGRRVTWPRVTAFSQWLLVQTQGPWTWTIWHLWGTVSAQCVWKQEVLSSFLLSFVYFYFHFFLLCISYIVQAGLELASYVAQAVLKLTIPLPQPLEWWDCRRAPLWCACSLSILKGNPVISPVNNK